MKRLISMLMLLGAACATGSASPTTPTTVAADAQVVSRFPDGRSVVCGHGIREFAAKVCSAEPKELRCGTVQGQGPTYGGATLPDASPCCEYACPQGQ
jgi:hypothetical protein